MFDSNVVVVYHKIPEESHILLLADGSQMANQAKRWNGVWINSTDVPAEEEDEYSDYLEALDELVVAQKQKAGSEDQDTEPDLQGKAIEVTAFYQVGIIL